MRIRTIAIVMVMIKRGSKKQKVAHRQKAKVNFSNAKEATVDYSRPRPAEAKDKNKKQKQKMQQRGVVPVKSLKISYKDSKYSLYPG